MNSESSIGIALSGGGARGIAHLGVLQALNEVGIFPERLSGTSAGAIAGALYCYGYAPKEILDIIIQTNFFRFLRPAVSWRGILKMEAVEELFKKYMVNDDFSALKLPLTVATVNLRKGKLVYFSKGPLIRAVMASACIPGMFNPIEIDNQQFIDGGALNNMPVEPLEGVCDYIIGVNCNHLLEAKEDVKNFKSVIERTVVMATNYNVYSRKNKCDYFIEPYGLGMYGVFDVKMAHELFKAGYKATQAFITSNPTIKWIAE